MAGRAIKLQRAVDHLVSVIAELKESDKGDDTGLTLGRLIARERAAWDLSLQDLANRANLSKAHVWSMEQGVSINPAADMILRLAEALRLPPIQVLNAALTSQRIAGEKA